MNDAARTLLADRARRIKQARELLDLAESSGRNLTGEEQRQYERLMDDAKALNKRAEREIDLEAAERTLDAPSGRRPLPGQDPTPGLGADRTEPGVEYLVDYRDGSRIPLLAPEQRMAAHAALPSIDPALVALAQATGNKRMQEEVRDLVGGQLSAGGALISAGEFVDRVRNQAVVVRAGARTVPFTGRTLTAARLETDPTAYWKPEGASGTASDPTFGAIMFQARTLFCLVKIAYELASDATNAVDILRNAMSMALALEWDRAALRGTGAGEEPTGILNFGNGVQTEALSTALQWDHISQAIQDIAEVNGTANAVVLSTRDHHRMTRIKDAEGLYVAEPPFMAGIRRFGTNQIPTNLGTGSDESEAYIGAFENLWIAVREEMRIEVSTEASDSSGSAFKNLEVWVRAYQRVDTALVRPALFKTLTGIL